MIRFHYQKTFTFKQRQQVKEWLHKCIQYLNTTVGTIDYVFCDNDYIQTINQKHLNHDYPTDIITFDYSEMEELYAEIYIAPNVVKSNAREYDTLIKDELHRVLIHGILHIVGYDDTTDEERQEMRAMEDYCLSLRTF